MMLDKLAAADDVSRSSVGAQPSQHTLLVACHADRHTDSQSRLATLRHPLHSCAPIEDVRHTKSQ